jgi:hypothetical protein
LHSAQCLVHIVRAYATAQEPEWRLAASGEDYAVWERADGYGGLEDDFNVDELSEQVTYYSQQAPGEGGEGEGGGVVGKYKLNSVYP